MSQPSEEHREASNVLQALQKAARTGNFLGLDLQTAFQKENWSAFQDVYADSKDPFVEKEDDQVVNVAWASRLTNSRKEIACIKTVLKVLLNVTAELDSLFEASEERIIAAKRSKGIKSLPDELLAEIFQIAVREQPYHYESVRQAVRLSRVSSRFRNVALGKHSLWTTLSSSSSRLQLETLISRAGPHERYHAFLNLNYHDENCTFAEICRSIIHRWSTATIYHDEEYVYRDRYGGYDDSFRELLHLLTVDGIQSPILEELRVRGNTRYPIGALLPDIQIWAPNLRTLRCSGFLPSLSSPLSSISTLTITYGTISPNRPASPLKMLLDFLRKLPNLSFFKLEVTSTEGTYGNDVFPEVDCPKMTSFQLQLPDFFFGHFNSECSCLASLMNALRMRSLEDYTISIGIRDYDGNAGEDECIEWSKLLSHLTRTLLPVHILRSTRIESLAYDLWIDNYPPSDAPSDSRTLNIPLDAISCVPSLTVSSFARVLFSRTANPKILQSKVAGECCSLRELKFTGCEYMTPSDLQRTINGLELIGAWSNIKRVVVQDCAQVTHEDAMNVVGEKRLRYLEGQFDPQRTRTVREYDADSLY